MASLTKDGLKKWRIEYVNVKESGDQLGSQVSRRKMQETC